MTVRMEFRDEQGDIPAGFWHREPVGYTPNQFAATNFMTGVTGQFVFWRVAFAKIMCQRGESHFEIAAQRLRLVEHHEDMNARINFRMPLRWLRNTK